MNCPACEADLDLDEEQLQEGGIVHCEDCGIRCEVVNLHPLELEKVPGDEDEDDDEDDDDFDEDDDDDLDEDEDEDENGYDSEDDLDDDEDEE